jgi:hypothetical protein
MKNGVNQKKIIYIQWFQNKSDILGPYLKLRGNLILNNVKI